MERFWAFFNALSPLAREIVILILSFAGIIIAAKVIAYFWRSVLGRMASRTRTKLDAALIAATEKPVYRVIIVAGFYVAFGRLRNVEGVAGSQAFRVVEGILYTLMVFAFAQLLYLSLKAVNDWYLAEVAHKTSTTLDEEFLPIFNRLSRIVIYFLAATVVLGHFGQNINGLIATAGVASLAVAFAAQETLSNMISGFTIMVDRPFRVGDRIQLSSGEQGDVYEIGLRSTKILSFDNTLIIVPNKEIAAARLINHSYPDSKVKIRPVVGVAYGTDLDRVKALMLDVCRNHPKVLKQPEPAVYFTEFGESSLNLMAICWVEDYRDRFSVLDEINMEIKRCFEREGIEIPFPQRDIHIIRPSRAGKA